MQAGPGFVPTFLYYFVSTTFIVVFVISNGLSNAEQLEIFNNPFQIGIFLGLIAGSLGAYFNSYESAELPLKNLKADLKNLHQIITSMGYIEVQEIDQAKLYERPFPSNFFAGKLILQPSEESIIVSGRSSRIRQLKKLFESQ